MFKVDSFGPTKRLTMARSFSGKAYFHCHAYLIDQLLIDTGCPCASKPFQSFLDNENISQAAVTHYHEDHAGNVISLNLSGIPVLAPSSSVKKIARGVVNQLSKSQLYALLAWGKSWGGMSEPLPKKIETAHHTFEVISMPGHSEDMHVFYVPSEGWLFSGDLFIAARRSYWRREEDPLKTMTSLRQALALDFDSLFCGHAPILKNGKEALKKKLEFMEETQQKAIKLKDEGLSISQIIKKLFGGEKLVPVVTLGDFSRQRFIEGLLAQPSTESAKTVT
ncbi:MAG: MBL fold metallo-hydrolase [Deltaproteobacteria bacterium]|nr:MBL fold metallo-hydrolase [Deltaproteobacteria bacterium]